MVYQLKKDPNRGKKKGPREIKETPMSQPEKTFDMSNLNQQSKSSHSVFREQVGQAKEEKKGPNKTYMLRVSRDTSLKVRALKGVFGLSSNDELVERAIERLVDTLSDGERNSYEVLLEVYGRANK